MSNLRALKKLVPTLKADIIGKSCLCSNNMVQAAEMSGLAVYVQV